MVCVCPEHVHCATVSLAKNTLFILTWIPTSISPSTPPSSAFFSPSDSQFNSICYPSPALLLRAPVNPPVQFFHLFERKTGSSKLSPLRSLINNEYLQWLNHLSGVLHHSVRKVKHLQENNHSEVSTRQQKIPDIFSVKTLLLNSARAD